MGVVNDPFYEIRNGNTVFENFTVIFGMCSLEVSVLTYKTFLIRSESFPYHKIFLKHLKNLLKKQNGVRRVQVLSL